jgi:hypothetical protein
MLHMHTLLVLLAVCSAYLNGAVSWALRAPMCSNLRVAPAAMATTRTGMLGGHAVRMDVTIHACSQCPSDVVALVAVTKVNVASAQGLDQHNGTMHAIKLNSLHLAF